MSVSVLICFLWLTPNAHFFILLHPLLLYTFFFIGLHINSCSYHPCTLQPKETLFYGWRSMMKTFIISQYLSVSLHLRPMLLLSLLLLCLTLTCMGYLKDSGSPVFHFPQCNVLEDIYHLLDCGFFSIYQNHFKKTFYFILISIQSLSVMSKPYF